MTTINCKTCSFEISETAMFCSSCGSQSKCKICNELISNSMNFCSGCGTNLKTSESDNKSKVKFQHNIDGTFLEAEFTDSTAKDLVESFSKILINRLPQIDKQNPINLSSNILNTSNEEIIDAIEVQVESKVGVSVMSLENVVIQKLPSSESEWIVIYAFYTSEYGKKIFKRQDLIDMFHKTKRKTALSNFARNLVRVIQSSLVYAINDEDYSIPELGVKKAYEILNRTSGSNSKPSPKKVAGKTTKKENISKVSTTSKVKTAAKSVTQEQFNIDNNGITLKNFFAENAPGNNTTKRILLIAYYIINYANQSSFSDGNIDYGYRVLGLDKRPKHLRQTITNLKNKNALVDEGTPIGNWILSRPGEIYIEDELLKSKK